ncbi:MAG: UvrD-helicase domain-containing protein [Anaerolineae bacterium]|nr:UvrD-helicase domain-containing protein [Anaerolineae bacterium]
MPNLLDKLNPQQREAVTTVYGPVLVLAGPGSGKTRVLTHRVAYLIREIGIPTHHIVAVTFTNKAAGEMRERVEDLLADRADGLQIGTFHAICARLLRVEAGMGTLPYNRDYAIYDTDDQLSLIKRILGELNVDTKKFQPGRILGAISNAKNELILPDDYPYGRDYFSEVVRRVYPAYQKRLIESNAMDFDDLLMQTVLLLRANETAREKYQRRYEHVMVDEFQDTNTAQYQLVKLLGKPQDNIFVVGDEDQGIYAFRGADYRNVMQFKTDYPAAHTILLEQNYRSTQIVLDTARAIIDRNRHRTPKALFTNREGGKRVSIYEAYSEADEGEYIATQIRRLIKTRGYRYRDFAIMYRTNAQSRTLEDAAVATGLPYRLIGGVAFYKRREIRDLLAYLKLVNNPDDSVSFQRIVNVPGRGIGEKSVSAFLAWAAGRGSGLASALQAAADGEILPITGRAGKSMAEFGQLICDLRALAEEGDLTLVFDEIIARTGYMIYLNESSTDTDDQIRERQENVSSLRGNISDKRDLALNDFLSDTALASDTDALDPNADAITLLTLHAAKGLEYPVVFITGIEEGLLPHSRSLSEPDAMAEERRLFYVGLTRARDEIHLTYAFRRTLYGDSMLSVPSRFLEDIPEELTEGVSPKIKSLKDRSGYQKSTTWESSGDRTPQRSAQTHSKVIPFPGRAAKDKAPEPQTKFKTGMKVFHATFGPGIVITSKRSGEDEEVEVRFDKVGFKRLSANFAKLTVL